MRELLQLVLVAAVIGVFAFLITQTATDAVSQRERLLDTLDDLLTRESVTLVDFIEALGQPKSLETVTCEGVKCIKAVWDLSYATVECWKRLIVILNEEEQSVFYSELIDLVVLRRSEEGTRCVEAPQ